jgi:phage shock protein D
MKSATVKKRFVTQTQIKSFGYKSLGIAIQIALHYGPAGIIGFLLKFSSRKPIRWLILMVIEPLLRAGITKIAKRLPWDKHETTAK